MEKKPFRLVSIAVANKFARIVWVMLAQKEANWLYEMMGCYEYWGATNTDHPNW